MLKIINVYDAYCVADYELNALKYTNLFLIITQWFIFSWFLDKKTEQKERSSLDMIMLWDKHTNQNQDEECDFRSNHFTALLNCSLWENEILIYLMTINNYSICHPYSFFSDLIVMFLPIIHLTMQVAPCVSV